MDLQFLGGVNEVGNLGMLLETEKIRYLFDYGITPTKPPRYPQHSPEIDLAFLTHAHIDHSGMMPWISSNYKAMIYSTRATSEISGLLARDSLKVAENEGFREPYSKKDINIMEHCFEIIEFGSTKKENGFDVNFHSAGHIPGATMFELQGDQNVLFTGDINTIDTRLVKGCNPVPCDTLIMEATYSGREHPDRREMEKRFLESVDEVISRGGKVILPAFAVGRSQEMLLLLKDTPYDIWLDGMGKEVTRRYLKHPGFLSDHHDLRRAFNQVNVVHSFYGRSHALKGDVIITTSGMLDGGPVLYYLEQLKKDQNSGIFLTGYQVEGTNGRMLRDTGRVSIRGVQEKIDMDVRFFDFSAHAGHTQLRDFANQCSPQRIILFHSDKRELLANDLREDGFQVILPNTGDVVSVSDQ